MPAIHDSEMRKFRTGLEDALDRHAEKGAPVKDFLREEKWKSDMIVNGSAGQVHKMMDGAVSDAMGGFGRRSPRPMARGFGPGKRMAPGRYVLRGGKLVKQAS